MDHRNSPWLGQLAGFLSLVVLLTAAALPARAGCGASGPAVALDIPAGNLGKAAVLLHEQAHVAVGYNPTHTPPSTAVHAVQGKLTLCDAFGRMLADTGLTFELRAANTFFVYYEGPRSAAAAEQEGPPEAPGSADVQLPDNRALRDGVAGVDEVVVTGSFIRGVQAITSPLQLLSKSELEGQSPFATLQDALRSQPMTFGAGAREIFDPQGSVGTAGDFNAGESVNLRGLGDGATLVLVDGVRQPLAGLQGDFVDISAIPLSAVDHVEILPDGASALYGSDAIAGVVNIILRKDLDGAESQVRYGGPEAGARETVTDQFFGTHWDTGKVLLGYQFSEHTALAASARAYTANTNQTPFGGTDYRSDESNPGNILDPVSQQPLLAIPRGSNGMSLTPASLLPKVVNLQNQLQDVDLLPNKRMHNFYAAASQRLGEEAELFFESRVSQQDTNRRYPGYEDVLAVPSTNPFNPLRTSPYTLVGYSFLDDLGPVNSIGETFTVTGMTGVKFPLSGHWRGTLTVSYGRTRTETDNYNEINYAALNAALADTNPATAFNAFGDGSYTNRQTLEAIRYASRYNTGSDMDGVDLVADGGLLDLPAGEARMAAGAAFRREDLDRASEVSGSSTSGRFDRTIASVYTELAVPLIAGPEGPDKSPGLELSFAARGERYSDVGSTVNPKVGFRWMPYRSVKLRGSWSTSFRAPGLVDSYDTSNNASGLLLVTDPHSATGQSVALVEQGNNTGLRNETASTWMAGLDLAPSFSGLTLSLTYYQTRYRERIFQPGAPLTLQQILSDPQWAPLVTRTPSSAQVAAICDSSTFIGPASQCVNTPPQVIIDARIRNLSATTVDGLDWQAQESLEALYGYVNLRIQGSSVFSYRQQVTPVAPEESVLDTVGNPLALRLHALAGWSQHGPNGAGLAITASVDYSNAYRDVSVVPNRSVSSWTVTNLEGSYRTAEGPNWTDNLQISMNATNLFNKDPPYVDRMIGFDPANAQPLGRTLSMRVRKAW